MTNKWQRTYFLSSLVIFSILALSKSSWAYQTHGGGTQTPVHAKAAAGDKNAKETYAVIQVGEDIRVISTSEKAGLQKKYDEEYKQDLKKYQEAKKDKNNHDANTKKPDKKDYTIKVLKGSFKTQEDAQKFADDKIKERDKGAKKSTDESKKW
ncbi:MAG: hypothetical protein ABSA26_14430 [Thermoguttaceae bacterium]|jgi:hypothetical protein